MANTYTLPGVLLSGTHAARPGAGTVAAGTLYAETDTGQTYQSDGSSTWTAWGLVAGGSGLTRGTPALTLSTTNSAGSAATGVATDATIAAFDATVPAAVGAAAAATGSAGTAARRDHQHGYLPFHGCRVINTAGTSISDSTLTAVPFAGTEKYDTDNWHDTVTNNTRITPTINGYYRMGGTITLASASTTGIRLIGVRLNGSTYVALHEHTPGTGLSTEQYISIATEYSMNGSTDYAELVYYQNTGGAVTLSLNSTYGAQFWMSLAGV